MGISIRAYARHRGVSHTAVRKAINAGRITTESNGMIDPDKADRQWDAQTDPSKQRGKQAQALARPHERKPSRFRRPPFDRSMRH